MACLQSKIQDFRDLDLAYEGWKSYITRESYREVYAK